MRRRRRASHRRAHRRRPPRRWRMCIRRIQRRRAAPSTLARPSTRRHCSMLPLARRSRKRHRRNTSPPARHSTRRRRSMQTLARHSVERRSTCPPTCLTTMHQCLRLLTLRSTCARRRSTCSWRTAPMLRPRRAPFAHGRCARRQRRRLPAPSCSTPCCKGILHIWPFFRHRRHGAVQGAYAQRVLTSEPLAPPLPCI